VGEDDSTGGPIGALILCWLYAALAAAFWFLVVRVAEVMG
jgi:hypothetical protein